MKKLMIPFAVSILVAFAVFAQEPQKKSQTSGMNMHEMMTSCREHCQKTGESLAGLEKTVSDARNSADVAQKNAALDAARSAVADMRGHMSMCMTMMEGMQKMHMGGGMGHMGPMSMGEAAKPVAGAREVRVSVSGGFSPQSVEVRKGEPVRLVFLRDEKPTCATEVVFPSLGIRRELPVGKPVAIDITPEKTGDIAFSCGMNMFRGKLVVVEQ